MPGVSKCLTRAGRIQPKDKDVPAFDMLTTPTVIQQRALDSLGVTLRLH